MTDIKVFVCLCVLQGATDLEKQLELLVVENERLKQELKSCRSSKLQKLDAAAETCSHCPHSQVTCMCAGSLSSLLQVC